MFLKSSLFTDKLILEVSRKVVIQVCGRYETRLECHLDFITVKHDVHDDAVLA